MAHKVTLQDNVDYVKDIILHKAVEKPHKSLVLHLKGGNSLLPGLTLSVSYQVIDSIGRIRYSGDHYHLAVSAYNKLYNE